MSAQQATDTPMVHLRVEEAAGRLLVSWRTDDYETFDQLKRDLRSRFPRHGDCIWCSSNKSWSLPAHHRAALLEWCAAWTTGPEDSVAWDVDDAGPRSRARPGGHTRARPARSELGIDAAYKALHLRKSAPPWLVDAVYRAASKHLHPDHVGGDGTAMAAVASAVALIRAHQTDK